MKGLSAQPSSSQESASQAANDGHGIPSIPSLSGTVLCNKYPSKSKILS